AHGVVVDVACGSDDEFVAAVILRVVFRNGVSWYRSDRFRGASDRAAEGVGAEARGSELRVGDVDRVVEAHRELFEDDPTFGFEFPALEHRGGDHVDDDVDRHRQVVVEYPRVVDGVLLGGGRVGFPTDRVERGGDLQRVALRGPFEQQVFQEVGGTVMAVGFVPGAHRHPRPERGGAGPGHVFGQHPDPAGENGAAHGGPAVLHDYLGARVVRRAEDQPWHLVVLGILTFVFIHDRVQGELAAGVDLGEFHLELLPHRQHVIDRVDPLPADELTHLGDVQQAVLARGEGDERPERRRLHDGSDEAFAHLGHLRVRDRVDRFAGCFGRRAADGADEYGAVVLDRDVGARVVLDLVDHLPLGADDLADLVHGHVDRDDPRGGRGHLVGHVDRFAHDVEDVQARVLRLAQCVSEHGGGDAVELRVHLDRGDEIAGSGDLEVHVAEGVFGAEDVGEGREPGLAVDLVGNQSHRDSGDRGAQGHTGVEQREGGGTDRTHRRGP